MGEAGPVGLAYHILFIDSPVSQAVQNMRDRPTVAASTFFLFYTGQSSGHHHILTLVGTEPYVLEIKSKLLIYRLFAAAMNQL